MFEDAKFKYEFRPYQKRVLDQVEKHIKDKKIHIVAAPGSRKNYIRTRTCKALKKSGYYFFSDAYNKKSMGYKIY